MRTLRTSLLVATAAVTLSGCIGLGGKTPPFLLTLDADAAPAAGAARTASDAATLTILIPTAPQKLRTPRIPVQQDDASVAYVKDAQWVEPPAKLFARLLADTITAKTDWVVLGTEQTRVDPGTRLSGELRHFGVEATSGEAVVTYDAALLRSGAASVEKRRFEARVPVASITAGPVGAALNQAANQIAAEVADWVGK